MVYIREIGYGIRWLVMYNKLLSYIGVVIRAINCDEYGNIYVHKREYDL